MPRNLRRLTSHDLDVSRSVVLHTDLASPEIRAALAEPLVAHRLSYPGGMYFWSRFEDSIGHLCSQMLFRDDLPYDELGRLYTLEIAGGQDGGSEALAPSEKNAISITAAGLIILGGVDFVTLAERIRGLGRLALVYTAPNDGATITELQWPSDADEPTAERVARLATMHGLGTPINFEAYDSGLYGMMVEIHHEPVNRSEVLFPLLHAYPLAPSSGSRQAQKLFDWADRLNGLAKTLGVHVDPLSFTPFWGIKGPTRRTARGTGTLAIFPGQRLSYDEMTRVPLPRNNLYGVGGTGSRQPIDPARPVMTDGFDLTPWFGDYGRRFLILYCLRASGWDFDPPVTEVGERARAAVRCPNAGGEAVGEHTCVARNPDGEGRPFEMYCEHPSCRGLGTLEMLALLEQASLVPLGSDSFSHFLCKTEFYLADPADVLGLPRVTRAKYLSRPVI